MNCIPADVIVKKLTTAVLERVPSPQWDHVKHEIMTWAAHYEHRMQLGSKEMFHIEAYCARLMSVLKSTPGCLAAAPASGPVGMGAGAASAGSSYGGSAAGSAASAAGYGR